jgi:hypothetical protein
MCSAVKEVVRCQLSGNPWNNYELVSNTWMRLWSSIFEGENDSPPKTNTRVPIEAIACPDRPLGEGPIFWNMYHRWSGMKNFNRVEHQRQLYILEILKAARSPRSLPSTPLPPKTYTTSSTRAAAWPSRGDGINPIHCNSDHLRVLISKAHVSL